MAANEMLNTPTFLQIIQPLFTHLNIDAPRVTNHQAINLKFKYIGFHLTPLNDEEILAIASLGCLPSHCRSETAWELLALNTFDQPAPAICLTLIGPERNVVLWSREYFQRFSAEDGVVPLFNRLIAEANDTIQLISSYIRT